MWPIPDMGHTACTWITGGLLVAVLLLGCGWAVDHEVQKTAYLHLQNDYQQLTINAEVRANEQEAAWKKQQELAQNAFAEREKRLQDSAAASAAANDSLRDTIQALRKRLSSNSIAANSAAADTLAIVFSECSGRYAAVAEDADRFANEAATLNEAWPK